MLAVTDLVKTFSSAAAGRREVQAVRGVSFEVPAGSFFTILGPSGCGKSTILRCLAGLEKPDGGTIEIDGQPVFSSQHRRNVPAAGRPIAMVFQSYAIWPHMSVFDNAAFPLRHGRRRAPRSEVKPRVMDMLERVGLAPFAQAWATQLSGGQQQRLALARALLCEPKVLLLDEPLSNLDARLRVSLRAELKSFQRMFGVTTVYVTHDRSEALALSDAIAVMSDGRIQQLGDAETVYNRPANAFVANFLGDANLVPCELLPGEGAAQTAFGLVRCVSADDAAAGPGMLCIRPEQATVLSSPDGHANVFQGKLLDSAFLGDHREGKVQLAGSTVQTVLPADLHLTPGSDVWLHLPQEHTTFFAEPQA
jgi:iron(III) transport system ATP-binding protein